MLEKLCPGIGLLCQVLGESVWPCRSWGWSWEWSLVHGQTLALISTMEKLAPLAIILDLPQIFNLQTYFSPPSFFHALGFFLLFLDSLVILGAWPLSNVGSCVCQCWHPSHVQLHSPQNSVVRRSDHLWKKKSKPKLRTNNWPIPNTFSLRILMYLRTQLAPF